MAETNTQVLLDSALAIKQFETEMNEECIPDDVYSAMTGKISLGSGRKQTVLTDAMFLKLSAAAEKANQVQITLMKDFSGDPQEGGNVDPRGKEEDPLFKTFTMEANDISHVHSNVGYGNDAMNKKPYNVLERSSKAEGKYFKQLIGKYTRQAIFEGQSQNLLAYPFYNAPVLNPNCFLPGVDDADQPKYSIDYQDQVNNVVHALSHAGLGVNAAISVRFVQRFQQWAFDNLDPLDMEDGKQGFVFVIPSSQLTWLKHPVNERSMGKMVTIFGESSGDKEIKMRFPGAWGDIDRIRIVEDMRSPTLTISGSPSASMATHPGSMTIKYYGQGRADDGSSDPRDKTASARQGAALIGSSAVCEWFKQPLHIEYDYKMYDKYFGSGPFGVFGSKLVRYNKTGANHANQLQCQGAAVTWFAAPPREGYTT